MNKKVMAFGSFDVIHPGHLHYLSEAARLGDHLVVVVARDDTIKSRKGAAPIFNEKERVKMVGSLRSVHSAMVGKKINGPDDFFIVIKEQKPDVLAFGYDQRVDLPRIKAWLKKNGLKTKIVRIKEPLVPRKYKSSKIKEKLSSI